jgi:lipopolysaccharide transport system permease protein
MTLQTDIDIPSSARAEPIDAHSSRSTARVVLRARSGWQPVNLHELWEYRELLWFLAVRDIKVRYKQTALGAGWAILQPFLTMVVFSIFFGKLAGLQEKSNVPYPVLIFCGLLPWQLFSNALTSASNSLVGSRDLITKIYFPRPVLPVSAVIAGLVDFALAFFVLVAMMAYYGVAPSWHAVTVPLFILLATIAALAVGLLLSALNVEYRDVRYTIPFLTQFWMFLSPVAYPSSIVPEKWRLLYGLNPMAGVVEGFRWAMLGTKPAPGPMLLVSSLATVGLLIGGMFYFRRMEKNFADLV